MDAEKVLWVRGPISCKCVTTARTIQVSLWVREVRIESRVFEDAEHAAEYAIDKMRIYSGANTRLAS
jgi:hypothetical protein